MINHVIVDFRPFVIEQNVMVYMNGECVDQALVPIEKITDTVDAFRTKYNINQIDLCGNDLYLKKFQAALKTKFNNDECEINITRR